jgi:hypothetical protein
MHIHICIYRLGNVSDSKDKNKKWLHALSLEPIVHMNGEDIIAVPVGVYIIYMHTYKYLHKYVNLYLSMHMHMHILFI